MKKILYWILATNLLAGCAYTPKVKTDFDRSADFSRYHTFTTVPGRIVSSMGVMDVNNTLLSNRVNEGVTTQLINKGLAIDKTNPDLIVTFLAGAQNKTDIESAPVGPYGGYRGAGWWGGGYDQFWTRNYKEGTLIIDLIDTKEKNLVWRAYCVGELTNDSTENHARLTACLQNSFDQFPPGSAPAK